MRDTALENMSRHVLRLWLQDLEISGPVAASLRDRRDEIRRVDTKLSREEIWNVKAIAAVAVEANKNG